VNKERLLIRLIEYKKRNLPRSGLLEQQVKANRDKYEHDRQG